MATARDGIVAPPACQRRRTNARAWKAPGQIENHHYKIHENLNSEHSIYIHAIKIATSRFIYEIIK
ncbi:hypothetical protein MKK67_05935 [Methylobacterium sp. J-072]|uniref:hypothetical protein n=1 Tax=Methylobacterium sp. J-072 TaxID=2836651 RepID=UPI001FB98EA0|nr:hypothetical protein [Methylobacterium sp. J-072]MCJ2092045.1 hypothetical protein [Methylobacterium sp. J-072]